ncbi:MAG: hypothetical protein R6V85_12190 [Polyangia bacterium]
MSDLAGAVLEALRSRARDRSLRVGALCRGRVGLLRALAAEGHLVAVISDRFRTLFDLQGRLGIGFGRTILPLEARMDALPLARRSLDALVVGSGLPAVGPPIETLARLRWFLSPRGSLIWAHPISGGVRGSLGRIAGPLRRGAVQPVPRHRLCQWAMAAGFDCVGQIEARCATLPWAVTLGSAGPLPPVAFGDPAADRTSQRDVLARGVETG